MLLHRQKHDRIWYGFGTFTDVGALMSHEARMMMCENAEFITAGVWQVQQGGSERAAAEPLPITIRQSQYKGVQPAAAAAVGHPSGYLLMAHGEGVRSEESHLLV